MATKMVFGLAALLAAQALATATSLDYYRSALCDSRSSSFFLERYTARNSPIDDKCHQAPAKTMAMKMVDGIDSRCVVLAYTDYACTTLVGSVHASGKCRASTKAKIGSWKAICNSTNTAAEDTTSGETPEVSYVPSELKRRSNARLPKIRQQAESSNITRATGPCTTGSTADIRTAVASSVASQISSGISADSRATVTAMTSPSATAQLSSVISSGFLLDSNLTSYVTYAGSASAIYTGSPSMTTTTPHAIVTYSGTTNGNGSATLYMGTASAQVAAGGLVLVTVLAGIAALLFGAIVL